MSEGDGTITNEPPAQQPTAAEQQSDGSRRLVTTIAPWADTLSKSVAAIAIAVYACGFLIVSLHHSNYGFIGTNPFRPRILAAGAWFLLFSAIPITAATAYREWSWSKIARNAVFIWSFCSGLSFPFSPLLFNTENVLVGHTRWFWVLLCLFFVLYLVATIWKKTPSTLVAIASLTAVLFFIQDEVRSMIAHNFNSTSVSLWFFGVFVCTMVELKVLLKGNLSDQGWWARSLGLLFVVLLVFAQYYYPHLKTSWGGGAPVNVTIYFSKDSPISPNKAVSAQLVEESDEGFYIVGPKEAKAIYLPRSAVALVYFSDKVADSPLLRDNK